ncbi:apolipoprotein N-acyltransferase [Aestuariicoccus sp. MJ-SS9]|uniref:apolipoprotein N-acyltransferase n=1 Tax=Aestuariicoccus sp. MJ-SS9 TaxID=3079855 RepID=UPI002911C868|nr:apolipoprotein N-acyltransferase [Aestuariicoccus sp. MJ-SS9]MDU8910388.1 apolipoprotein N-acyltransferase [Aestuariicoccus sp. MJ-SS9]
MPDRPDAPDRRGALPAWGRLPLSIGFGCLFALGQAPYDLWYVALPGLAAAFLLFRAEPGPMRALGVGWAFGLGYFGLALGWIVEPFQVDAAATGWMAPFGLIGLAAGLALFWALAFWAAALARRPWVLVPVWAAAELARAYVFTGFPWALVGYLWAPTWAIQWVSVIGPHGVSLATLALAGAAAAVWPLRSTSARWGGAALLIALALLAGGRALLPPAQDLTGRPVVRLVQPNAPQHQKWDPAMIPVFFKRKIDATSALPRPDLVVWPETAVPTLLHNAGPAFDVISEAAGPVPVVLGIQRAEGGRFYNSLTVLDEVGRPGQIYDKHHLVPFGEYMPARGLFARWNIAGLAARAEAGYAAGPGPQVIDLGPLGLALPLICYEAVFPQDVHRAPVRPAVLMQLTNDAWFGDWSGPYQHLAQARIRAIEQGLPLMRAANTGVSAMIDPGGRILASLGLGQTGHVDAPLPAPLPPTPYARTGDLPVLALLFALCLGGFTLHRRRR